MTDTPTAVDQQDVAPAVADLDTIVSLSKRRGFIFPSSEIYGGINAVWDYGPLGVELKNNVKRAWWRAMVQERDDIVGLDAGILMHPQVWVTSGHVAEFSDPMVECQTDHKRFRVDELPGAEDLGPKELLDPGIIERLGLKCPIDGGPLSAPRQFNLMLKTHLGPVEEDAAVVYLRPETAQGIYVNFKNVQATSRKKLPFGIAQIGKAFRNEISPGNFVFRMREFEQMEMQYFVRPDEATAAFEAWLPRRRAWYERYGVTPSVSPRRTAPTLRRAERAGRTSSFTPRSSIDSAPMNGRPISAPTSSGVNGPRSVPRSCSRRATSASSTNQPLIISRTLDATSASDQPAAIISWRIRT